MTFKMDNKVRRRKKINNFVKTPLPVKGEEVQSDL